MSANVQDLIDEAGYMEWFSFLPRDNVIVVRMIPQKLKKALFF